jgi:peptidyl-prolyl cis-trans isomerase C
MENTNNKLGTKILMALVVIQFIYILFAGGGSSSKGAMEREYSGDVIAEVNGDDIKEEEFRERLDFITGGRGGSINMANIDEKGLQALAKEVYVQRLVLDEAVDSGVQKDEELKNKVASLVNTIYKEKFLENIAKKEITDEKIKKTYEELVSKAKNSKQYKVKHILVKTEAEANAAKEKIAGDASFEDIARLDSLDKASAAKGGDLGYIFPEEFVKEFAEAVKKAPNGDVVGPVKTQFGYHLILVTDSKAAEIVPFEQAKPRIEKQLGADAVKAFVDSISKDLEIEIVKKPEAPAAAAPAAGKAEEKK